MPRGNINKFKEAVTKGGENAASDAALSAAQGAASTSTNASSVPGVVSNAINPSTSPDPAQNSGKTNADPNNVSSFVPGGSPSPTQQSSQQTQQTQPSQDQPQMPMQMPTFANSVAAKPDVLNKPTPVVQPQPQAKPKSSKLGILSKILGSVSGLGTGLALAGHNPNASEILSNQTQQQIARERMAGVEQPLAKAQAGEIGARTAQQQLETQRLGQQPVPGTPEYIQFQRNLAAQTSPVRESVNPEGKVFGVNPITSEAVPSIVKGAIGTDGQPQQLTAIPPTRNEQPLEYLARTQPDLANKAAAGDPDAQQKVNSFMKSVWPQLAVAETRGKYTVEAAQTRANAEIQSTQIRSNQLSQALQQNTITKEQHDELQQAETRHREAETAIIQNNKLHPIMTYFGGDAAKAQEYEDSRYQQEINSINSKYSQARQGATGGTNVPAKSGGSLTIVAPNNKTYTFKDQASLDNFKREAGIP